MCCLLSATRSLGFILCTRWSRKRYSPVQSPSSMPSTASRVDFPAPDGPMMETNSPAAMSRVICRRMNSRPFPWEMDLSRFLSSIMTSVTPLALLRLGERSQRIERHERERQRGRGKYATQNHGKAATEYGFRLAQLLVERGHAVHWDPGVQALHDRAYLARSGRDAYLGPQHQGHPVLRHLEVG